MPELRCYQVDAFAERPFEGNPAAVVPLGAWLDDAIMQEIAAENNLSETAFFVPVGEAFALRWFTPTTEVDLCGHATLASAFILMNELEPQRQKVRFDTRSGPLHVKRDGATFTLDLPPHPVMQTPAFPALDEALGKAPREIWLGRDWLCLYDDEQTVRSLAPDFRALGALGKCVVATAPGTNVDVVSRYFAPSHGIDEDPVTGAGHCMLAPFWSKRLRKNEMSARQVSKRGGNVGMRVAGDRVELTGRAVLIKRGTLYL